MIAEPSQVHTTLSHLLAPLEQIHGVPYKGDVGAFAPRPFGIPLVSGLERHNFAASYEFINLRVLFVAWINACAKHRKMEKFWTPWDIGLVLQHTEGFKRLKAHPESAVRVALLYIFNETQLVPGG